MATRSAMVSAVGARVRSLRTARGLTQAQLADPLYTKAYISMLESGRTRASMKALEHIATVLGVTPADLLGGATADAAPQFSLAEACRLSEEGRPEEALGILTDLDAGLQPADQLVRLRYLASAYGAVGRAKDAFPVAERAQRMAALLGDAGEAVRVKAVLASLYRRTHAFDESIRLLGECIDACDKGDLHDPPFLFRRLVDLATSLAARRQSKVALPIYERALQLAASFDDRRSLANVYAGMAHAYQADGDIEAAIRYDRRSLDLYEDLGLIERTARAFDSAAALYAERGEREHARESLATAARLATEIGSDTTLASIRVSEAEVAAQSDREGALEIAQAAFKFAKKADEPDAQVRALMLIAELRHTSNPTAARRSFNEALQIAETRAPHLLRTIYERWSRAAEANGDGDEALRLARRALELVRA